jgi:hypothetical protein
MPRQRPGSVTAAAILAIIYGGLFTLCNLCGLISTATQGAMNKMIGGNDPQQAQIQKQVEEVMERDVPLYRPMQYVGPTLGLLLSVAFLAAGIGLLGVHSWARLLAIGTAGLTVVVNLVMTVYQLAFVMPAMNRVFTEVLPQAMAKGPGPVPPAEFMTIMKASLITGIIIAVVIQLAVIAYLLLIVFLLMRRAARAAFAGVDVAGAADVPDQGEDEGWGRSAEPHKREPDDRGQPRKREPDDRIQ